MRSSPLLLPALFAILLGSHAARAQDSVQGERIAAAFVLATGRVPTGEEIRVALLERGQPLAALYAKHREEIGRDTAVRRAVAYRAGLDAWGRPPTDMELASQPAGRLTYSERLQLHSASLATDPVAYRQVIDRAYRFVLGREPYDLEHEYWRSRPPLPYLLLVAAVENWAQRNAPGLTVTSGTPSVSVNCRFLTTVRLSPAVANEARVILGLPVWTDVARQAAPDRSVVAAGASEITSIGGIHFVAAGGNRFGSL